MFDLPSRWTRGFCVAALAILLAGPGCGPSFREAQNADTIEAYENYLSQVKETDPFYYQARVRLEELRLEAAREEGTLEAFDAFLEQYPEGSDSQLRDKAFAERKEYLYRWADEQGTREAWEQFLEDYPRARKKKKVEARRRIHMAENRDAVRVEHFRQQRVNLAEDPEGALDGWGFYADVTNVGDRPIEKLEIGLYLLGPEGEVLKRIDWPVVAKALPGFIPFAEGFDEPMKKGDTRTWEYTTGDLPEGWSRKARVAPVHIVFVDESESGPG